MKTGIICRLLGKLCRTVVRKEKDLSGSENNEKCIICGRDTGIPVSVPIEDRGYFIVGCGQLCENCYDELQYETVCRNKLTDKDMALLLHSIGETEKERINEEST